MNVCIFANVLCVDGIFYSAVPMQFFPFKKPFPMPCIVFLRFIPAPNPDEAPAQQPPLSVSSSVVVISPDDPPRPWGRPRLAGPLTPKRLDFDLDAGRCLPQSDTAPLRQPPCSLIGSSKALQWGIASPSHTGQRLLTGWQS